jgi:hypothetical protein
MSSPLAIAAVTAVLRSFVHDAMIDHGLSTLLGEVTVSSDPPDSLDLKSTAARINLFLFQATENQGWRNFALPARSPNGDRTSNPPLALDLSYLVTAYGVDDYYPEVLLGYAMFVLHEMPVFTRDAIRDALGASSSDPLFKALTTSSLADQIEQIKIVPQTMSVDELSKIWTALQSQYRPTAVYKVSVVLIESEKSVKPTLPVRARNLLVLPFEHPSIDGLQSQASDSDPIVANQPILAGYNLVIDGQQLRGESTLVVIDDTEVTPNEDKIIATRIIVALPGDLQPGLHSVQVVQRVDFGTGLTSDPHRGVESNVAAFVLAPQITASPTTVARGDDLVVGVEPAIGSAQRTTLLVGNGTISIPARPADDPPTTELTFPIPDDFGTGVDQLLRVQIDGAESPLATDAAGKYVSPTVDIT